MSDKHTRNQHLLLVYGELDEDNSRQVRNHIKACHSCRHDFELLEKSFQTLNDLPLERPSPEIHISVLQMARRRESVRSRVDKFIQIWFAPFTHTWQWTKAMAVCALIIFFALVFSRRQSHEMIEQTGDMAMVEKRLASNSQTESLETIDKHLSYLRSGDISRTMVLLSNIYFDTVIDGELQSIHQRLDTILTQLQNSEF